MGLFQSVWHPHFKKEKSGDRQANRENTDVFKPRRGPIQILLWNPQKEPTRRTPWFWTSSFQNWDNTFLWFKPLNLWSFVMAAAMGHPYRKDQEDFISSAWLTVSPNSLHCFSVPVSCAPCPISLLTKEGPVMSSELQLLSRLSS